MRAELAFLTRQLALLFGAGVPIVRALEVLARQAGERLRPRLEEAIGRLTRGGMLSEALGVVLPPISTAMIRVGEQTGGLAVALEHLADWMQADLTLSRRVRAALVYPVVVLAVLALLTLAMFAFVLPGFAPILSELAGELPWPTRVVLFLSRCAADPLAWIALLLCLAVWGKILKDMASEVKGRLTLFRLLMAVPLVGTLVSYATLARYASALHLLLSSGVEIRRALRLAAQASGNPLLIEDAEAAVRGLEEGVRFSDHLLSRPELYPPLLAQLLRAGEESSRMPQLARRASQAFSEEVATRIETLGAALEPILLLVVGIEVGFVLLSVLLPLYRYAGELI